MCRPRTWSAAPCSSFTPPMAMPDGGKSGIGRSPSATTGCSRRSTRRGKPGMTEKGESLSALARALGHRFAKPALLAEALTHPSKTKRRGAGRHGYERLEFLGDRVLGVIVAELLWRRFPDADEGEL